MHNTISFYGNYNVWLTHFINHHNKNLKIGVINWWWLNNEQADITAIENFVDSNDITFFLSEEILSRYHHVDINKLFTVLNQKNVYYILAAEDYSLTVPPIRTKTFYYPWFFKIPLHDDENFKVDTDYVYKEYDFNLLLGSKKSNRSLMFKILKDNPKIYSTYFGHPKFKNLSKTSLEEAESLAVLDSQDIENEKLNTMLLLNKNDINYCLSQVVPRNIYNNSHFDIVAETFIKENHQFLTEKTAKPLATGRFFCWYASPHVKDYLGRYGFSFETYYQNYDSIDDHICRLDALLDDIKEISNNELLIKHIYDVTKDERMHNKINYENQRKRFLDDVDFWVGNVLKNA